MRNFKLKTNVPGLPWMVGWGTFENNKNLQKGLNVMAKKGTTNNPAGRPAGVPNRLTKELRGKLKAVLDAEIDGMPELLAEMEPAHRLELVVKMLGFILPKVNPVGPCFGEPTNFDFD